MGQLVVFVILLLIAAILGTPLVVGIVLLRRPHKNALVWYAGLLTLKPVFIALLWLFIILAKISVPDGAMMVIAPAVGLTLIFSLLCRSVFRNADLFPAIRLLLILDTVRWGAALLGLLLFSANRDQPAWALPICFLGIFALGLPTIFAYAALYVVNEYVPDSK